MTTTQQGERVGPEVLATLPDDVAYETIVMVNVVFVGAPGAADWVLVDAGLPASAERIATAARQRYGDVPPRAILLTHGHFDHVGALRTLADQWDVPIYAHELEAPYLTGKAEYPPPDPIVGGGLMARLSPLYPKAPIDVSDRLRLLPDDGSIPVLPDWRWVATPGHSPGHVAFYRDSDGTLIAGDAFINQRQESLVGVLTAAPTFRGPPTYFTPDWDAARDSVRRLAALRPRRAVTGHGHPLANPRLDHDLDELARRFDEVARPKVGRYRDVPAVTDLDGVVSLPPAARDDFAKYAVVGGVIVAAAAAYLVWKVAQERETHVRPG